MKSLNLEQHYINLDKHIKLFCSFIEKQYYADIIKSCRLTPHNFTTKDYKKIKLFKKWQDEYGNSINIEKDKKIKIIYNDLSIKKIIKTDIYQGLVLEKIFKISNKVFFLIGKDDTFNNDFIVISLMGIDNYLRTFLFYCNEWKQVSSLLLGENILKIIINNKKNYEKIKIKKKFHLPCIVKEAWITYLPTDQAEIKTKIDVIINNTKGNI